jgi:hypothetical protein
VWRGFGRKTVDSFLLPEFTRTLDTVTTNRPTERERLMQCPACRYENPAPAKFCLECGASLVVPCPNCRTELPHPQSSVSNAASA